MTGRDEVNLIYAAIIDREDERQRRFMVRVNLILLALNIVAFAALWTQL